MFKLGFQYTGKINSPIFLYKPHICYLRIMPAERNGAQSEEVRDA
jgi:hypothetical protein